MPMSCENSWAKKHANMNAKINMNNATCIAEKLQATIKYVDSDTNRQT